MIVESTLLCCLIDKNDWSRCIGKVVHYPKNMTPAELQREIIIASAEIYSVKRLISAILHKRGLERILFMGEFFWQKNVRKRLKKELPYLEEIGSKANYQINFFEIIRSGKNICFGFFALEKNSSR